MIGSIGLPSRLISSQVFQPTSPAQTSVVPGRMVIRKGLRRPYAMIRRAFASLLAARGLSGLPAPVTGSIRAIVPSRLDGIRRRPQVLASKRASLGASAA